MRRHPGPPGRDLLAIHVRGRTAGGHGTGSAGKHGDLPPAAPAAALGRIRLVVLCFIALRRGKSRHGLFVAGRWLVLATGTPYHRGQPA